MLQTHLIERGQVDVPLQHRLICYLKERMRLSELILRSSHPREWGQIHHIMVGMCHRKVKHGGSGTSSLSVKMGSPELILDTLELTLLGKGEGGGSTELHIVTKCTCVAHGWTSG